MIKHSIENKSVAFRNRYVDNILIIYDHTKFPPTQKINLHNCLNNNTKFSIMQEINANNNCLHLLIHKTNTEFENDINRKSMSKSTVIHFTSIHPIEHKKIRFSICLIQIESITNKHY